MKYIKYIIPAVLLVSILGNAYYFGNQWLQRNNLEWANRGASAALSRAYEMAVQNGEIQLTKDGNTITLKYTIFPELEDILDVEE